MMTDGMYSSNTDQWATPQDFFDEINKEFNLELDVCADHYNHKCDIYFTKHDNGLTQNWYKRRCWMNPPYGREIGKWVKKASESNTLVVCLLPARTDTKWFHDYIYNKAEIRFIKGRLKFGYSKNSAPFPSMIVIFKGGNK
jgi:phage N-6-adenine-methyltransferase